MFKGLLSAVLVIAGAFLALSASDALCAERRVALVIGNSHYQSAGLTLTNPQNDARDVAAVLKSLGFETTEASDLTKTGFDKVLQKFAHDAQGADSALFYYAGHAMQFRGENYLMPVDATLESEFSVRYEMVPLDDIHYALASSNGVKILILDACRNNPLADNLRQRVAGRSRSIGELRGLARIDKTQGMVIAYATAADAVARDGNGRNSPFTAALLKRMQEPGLEIGTLFRRVASDVNNETHGQQRPETTISLLGDYFLNRSDQLAWDRVKDSSDPEMLREFIGRYPSSPRAIIARDRLQMFERFARERQEEAARKQQDALQSAKVAAEVARLRAEHEAMLRQQEQDALLRKQQQEAMLRKQEQEALLRKQEQEQALLLQQRQDEQRAKQAAEAARLKAEQAIASHQQQQAKRPQPSVHISAADPEQDDLLRKQQQEALQAKQAAEAARVKAEKEAALHNQQQEALQAKQAAEAARVKAQQEAALRKQQQEALQARQAAEAARVKAEQEAALRRQQEQAAKAAAVAEAERVRQERHAREQKVAFATQLRQEIDCMQDRTAAVAIAASDAAGMQNLLGHTSCDTVKASLSARITTIEKEHQAQEQACKREDEQLAQLRASGADAHDQLAQFAKDMTCERLRPVVLASLGNLPTAPAPKANTPELVREAQRELSRLGCFSGRLTGKLDRNTEHAISRYSKEKHQAEQNGEVTEDLVAALKGEGSRVCPLVCPRGEILKGETCVASRPARRPVETSHAPRPAPSHEVVRRSNPEPSARNQATSAPPRMQIMGIGGM